MLSIQDAAKELFITQPKQFYFFVGPDYGVKLQYVNKLIDKFNNTQYDFESIQDAYESLSKKTLIPRSPAVYVVRYDNQAASASVNLHSLKFPGILLTIIDDEALETKLDKKYPDNVIRFNHMNTPIVFKNLTKKFPNLPTAIVESIASLDIDFYEAQTMCQSLSYLPSDSLTDFTKHDIISLFDYNQAFDELKFKRAVLSRSYKLASIEASKYEDDKSALIYSILSAYLEVLNCLENKHRDSYARKFVNKWNVQSVKIMYDVTFDQLTMLRKYPNYSPDTAIDYILGMLQFKVE